MLHEWLVGFHSVEGSLVLRPSVWGPERLWGGGTSLQISGLVTHWNRTSCFLSISQRILCEGWGGVKGTGRQSHIYGHTGFLVGKMDHRSPHIVDFTSAVSFKSASSSPFLCSAPAQASSPSLDSCQSLLWASSPGPALF